MDIMGGIWLTDGHELKAVTGIDMALYLGAQLTSEHSGSTGSADRRLIGRGYQSNYRKDRDPTQPASTR